MAANINITAYLFIFFRIFYRKARMEKLISPPKRDTVSFVFTSPGLVLSTPGLVLSTPGLVLSTPGLVLSTPGLVRNSRRLVKHTSRRVRLGRRSGIITLKMRQSVW